MSLTPIRMRDVTLEVDTEDVTIWVNQVVLTPRADIGWSEYLCGGQVPYLTRTRWFLTIAHLQDVATPTSLSRLLLTHHGEQRTMRLSIPGLTVQVRALLMPADLGGAANTIPTGSLSLPVVGEPTEV